MSIWGHDVVRVEKDVEKKCWHIKVAVPPHAHLVTVPWIDAFKGITKLAAPDYFEAIQTAQSDERTALTTKEEAWAIRELDRERRRAAGEAVEEEPTVPDQPVAAAPNVIPIDFKRKRRT